MRDRVYFISDVHLGSPGPRASTRARERALCAFLRQISQNAEVLYILGDLFDFWFEYHHVVPRAGARVLHELGALTRAGVRVVCLPGNHDIWLGAYLSDVVGMELPGGPVTASHQGLRLHLAHGDELRRDPAFRLSRGLLRHPLAIAAFRTVHPDLAVTLARVTAMASRARTLTASAGGDPDWPRFREMARRLLRGDLDAVVVGHFHHIQCEPMSGGRLVVLGDWLRHRSYGVLHGGELSVRRFVPSD